MTASIQDLMKLFTECKANGARRKGSLSSGPRAVPDAAEDAGRRLDQLEQNSASAGNYIRLECSNPWCRT
jgi:hypothetical protein